MDQTPDLKQIMKLAQSPAGQQLLQLLQKNSSGELQNAVNLAAQGNYIQAKNALTQLLNTPEAIQLLNNLEEQK